MRFKTESDRQRFAVMIGVGNDNSVLIKIRIVRNIGNRHRFKSIRVTAARRRDGQSLRRVSFKLSDQQSQIPKESLKTARARIDRVPIIGVKFARKNLKARHAHFVDVNLIAENARINEAVITTEAKANRSQTEYDQITYTDEDSLLNACISSKAYFKSKFKNTHYKNIAKTRFIMPSRLRKKK